VKMWSGRFSSPVDPDFDAWQRSFPYDRRLLSQEICASKAHAGALNRAGILSEEETTSIVGGLDRILSEGVPATDDPSIEDVHHFVESRLIAMIGESGRKLHTGRSRNEQIATDMRLYVRDRIGEISVLIAELISALIERAEASGSNAMPSYTHQQRAEPVLVAHWLLAYVEMLFRDLDRLNNCKERLNRCPLGSGAIAGTFIALDRARMACALGFSAPTNNSMDATSDRDFAIEFANAVSLLALHMSRWADELILFSTTEYGFITLPERYSTGSSAMPQKKNPDSLELIRGKSARIMAAAAQLSMTIKGLPLAYNKDLQETQEPVFACAEQIAAILRIASGFVQTVQFNYEVMQKAASIGFMNAMSAAGHLVRNGVPFRTAHEQIGAAVRIAIGKGCELEELTPAELEQCGISGYKDFYGSLTLESVLAAHDVEGGTAPARVAAALAAAKKRVAALMESNHACA
jgi:argininosuccinate lyase